MSAPTPRHRGQTTPEHRERERKIVLLVAFLVGAGVYLVLPATVWDPGVTALGILLCGVIGTLVQIRRDRRVRGRDAEEHPRSGGPSAQGDRDLQASLGAIEGRLNGVDHVPQRINYGKPGLLCIGKRVLRPGLEGSR